MSMIWRETRLSGHCPVSNHTKRGQPLTMKARVGQHSKALANQALHLPPNQLKTHCYCGDDKFLYEGSHGGPLAWILLVSPVFVFTRDHVHCTGECSPLWSPLAVSVLYSASMVLGVSSWAGSGSQASICFLLASHVVSCGLFACGFPPGQVSGVHSNWSCCDGSS